MDAEPKTATDPDLTFVKVFSSENEDNWIELGIGRLSIVSHSDSFEIIVLPDNDGPALLKCSLATVFGVARPETNIIAWRQSLTSELALSFMDSDQCTKFLNAIQSFQARSGEQPQSEDITANDESDSSSSSNDENMQYEESQSDEHCDDITDENAAVLQERDQTSDTQVSITHSILARQPLHPISTDNSDFKLPLMDLKHLESISICFTRSFFLPGKQTFLANYLLSDDHHNLNRLFELFHLCDDLLDLPSLYCIHTIVRGSLQIHDNDFLNVLLNTENRVMDVIGALEFNPADSDQEGERFSHRSYLLKNYFLNDVTCIEDVDLLKLIHKTFRLQYITDIMMPPAFIFEDNHLNGLTEYVVKCKTDIVLKMIDSIVVLRSLCDQIRLNEETENERQRNIFKFIKELCIFIVTATFSRKKLLLQELSNCGLLSTIHYVLLNYEEDRQMIQLSLDIFCLFVDHCIDSVWQFCLNQVQEFKESSNVNTESSINEESQDDDDSESILEVIIGTLVDCENAEGPLGMQITQCIRTLLDKGAIVMGVLVQPQEVDDKFVNLFIDRCMPLLMAPVLANTVDGENIKDDKRIAQLQYVLLDIIVFLLDSYSDRMSKYLIDRALLCRALVLLSSKHHYLKLASLRLLRKVIGLSYDSFDKFINDKRLLDVIITAFIENKRSNLFEAAVLELFDFILKEDREILMEYFANNLFHLVKDSSGADLFTLLNDRYTFLSQQPDPSTCAVITPNPMGITEQEDLDEQIYFNEEEPCESRISPCGNFCNDSIFAAPVRKTVADDNDEGNDEADEFPLNRFREPINKKLPLIRFNFKSSINASEESTSSSIKNKNSLVSYPVDSDEEPDE